MLPPTFVANGLLESLETQHDFLTPNQADRTNAQAIVILAAGVVTKPTKSASRWPVTIP